MKYQIKKIAELGTFDLSEVEVSSGQLELHVPIVSTSSQVEEIIDRYMGWYKKQYPEAREDKIFFDFRLVYSFGYDNPEFQINLYIWQETETGEQVKLEIYDVVFQINPTDSNYMKKLIWDRLGEAIFGCQ